MITTDGLHPFLQTTLDETSFDWPGKKYTGKVRDVYMPNEHERILTATDRQSAFDVRKWCTIPLKGQVLTQISKWWFDRVADVLPTHVIEAPDPNVMVVKALRMVMVEIVVRGYLAGSTNTSAWVNYQKGIRHFCGNVLPEGMVKNQTFAEPIVTPTTKSEDDELIDPVGIPVPSRSVRVSCSRAQTGRRRAPWPGGFGLRMRPWANGGVGSSTGGSMASTTSPAWGLRERSLMKTSRR